MSWWAILIVLLSVCMCLGPVMLMQPSTTQRRLAQLRAKALDYGLKVRSGSIKTPPGNEKLCVYFRPWSSEFLSRDRKPEPWCLLRSRYEHPVHFYKTWSLDKPKQTVSLTDNSVIYSALDELPESMRAVECTATGMGLYWNEQGGEEVLEQMSVWLEKVARQIEQA